jgi:flavin reductase (DIM6/NTAB) family NADH-FMN oxidoreductase RutF
MQQKLHLEERSQHVQTGPVQFFDKMGQLDWPGLYLTRADALSIANAIEALDCHLKSESDDPDSVLYAVYFKRLLAIREMIRNEM